MFRPTRLCALIVAVALAGCSDAIDSQSEDGPDLTCEDGRLFIDHSPKGLVAHKENVTFTHEARDTQVLGTVWVVEGETVAGAEAVHAFATPGVHEVELRAFTETGCVLVQHYEVELMNKDPTAVFTMDKVNGKLALDASGSTDPNGDDLSYLWSVDGEAVAEGELALIAEPEAGAVVAVSVQDPHGGEDRAQAVVS